MNRVECSVISRWIGASIAGEQHGVCLLGHSGLPSGLRLVVVSNDGEATSNREILSSLSDLANKPSSCLSLGVRNDSLAAWRIGYSGFCDCGQVWFLGQDGTEKSFSIVGSSFADISYSNSKENCKELRIEFDSAFISEHCKQIPALIAGKIEVSNHAVFKSVDYNVLLLGVAMQTSETGVQSIPGSRR